MVGDTRRGGAAKRARLDSLVHYDSAIASLSIALGHDASGFDPDGPLPEIPETNASKSGRERVIDLAQAREPDRPPARPAPRRLWRARLRRHAGDHRRRDGGMAGQPRARDGFNVMFPYLPGGLDDFVDRVVPELQRRGIFRREYEGKTLRENLGLPRPENRSFRGSGEVAGGTP